MPAASVHELNINYKILGSGKPLVLIIGLSFSLADWGDRFPDLLAQNYQVILFDNRDAGLTSESQREYAIADLADDTANLLAALKIPKAHIFGVSMGGMIAQQLVLRHPSKVNKLILGCTMAGGVCSQYGNAGDLTSALFSGNFSELLFPSDYIKSHAKEIDELFDKSKPLHSQDGALQRQMLAFLSYDACDDISKIQAETFILTGDQDLLIPETNSKYLHQQISNSTLEIIDNAGHGFCFSHDIQSAKLITDFLK
jgi:3-oxoadipate enol-lactonase